MLLPKTVIAALLLAALDCHIEQQSNIWLLPLAARQKLLPIPLLWQVNSLAIDPALP